MKTKKENREEIRRNSVCVLFTAEEKARVEKAAFDMGVSKSTFMRIVVKDYFKKTEG